MLLIERLKGLNDLKKQNSNFNNIARFVLCDKKYFIETKNRQIEVFNLFDIFHYLNTHNVYFSNFSFIEQYSTHLNKFNCNVDFINKFHTILTTYQDMERLFIKKISNISKFILKGYELLDNVDDCVFFFRNKNDFYVVSEYTIVLNPDLCLRFSYLNITYLYIDNLDISGLTTLQNFFVHSYKLKHIILKNFDTSNINSFGNMFYGCNNLEKVDMSSFITDNVINFSNMFCCCYSLKNVNLNNFIMYKGVYFCEMFKNCISLETIDMRKCRSDAILAIDGMFSGCENLKELYCNNLIPKERRALVSTNNYLRGCDNLEKVMLNL